MELRKKIGISASIGLVVGTFLPVINSPEYGTRLFIGYVSADGVMSIFPFLVLMSAALSVFFIQKERNALLWASSFVALISVVYPFYKVWETVDILQKGYDLIKSFSPSSAEGLEPLTMQFGWVVLIFSAILVLISAAMGNKELDLEGRIKALTGRVGENKMQSNQVRLDWTGWDVGGKMIFASSALALFSFFLPWIDIGFTSRNGFSQGSFLLGAFYIYPLYKLLVGSQISKGIGTSCALASLILTVLYILSKTVEIFDETVNASSAGVDVFIVATIILAVGIWIYKAPDAVAVDSQPVTTNISIEDPNDVKMSNDIGNIGKRIPCPQCAELIMPEAKICRFCRADLTN